MSNVQSTEDPSLKESDSSSVINHSQQVHPIVQSIQSQTVYSNEAQQQQIPNQQFSQTDQSGLSYHPMVNQGFNNANISNHPLVNPSYSNAPAASNFYERTPYYSNNSQVRNYPVRSLIIPLNVCIYNIIYTYYYSLL
ncbi:hypothetical protein CONCODRAFT_79441 [Conidiobolus coronatus NRRL 28638]|uniref:Uncharacterized protein n=1 Tax=Conidiobolus coronatus (strain ATCC 28846 / CBS 209.66 / NRRL 28638) TaxID=796925 RepID=A0A137P2P5_CONC2|nr:hypothetical protein CONCODRAFT_79441 [Conidiobolus coronatus NRRL 28638]|eukprot:KXN69189.1 hypothetical protein CONCODRAFT_79441 [Conidiobolus coronatus NRRL 28638]